MADGTFGMILVMGVVLAPDRWTEGRTPAFDHLGHRVIVGGITSLIGMVVPTAGESAAQTPLLVG